MPFIAVFGIQFNDVFFTVLIASLNVGLIAKLLRTACHVDFLHLSKQKRAILVFFFAFGTVHFTLAPYGKVWMTGQLVGFTCVLLSYLAAFSLKGNRAWFFTGLTLAGAMLTRNTMVFSGIFPFVYLFSQQKYWKNTRLLHNIASGTIPLIISLVLYLLYNYVRFSNPFNMGVDYHNMSVFFHADYEVYGLFNIHYLPINVYYQYFFTRFQYV